MAEERLRFARDMHDLLGHDLSLIALKAELAGELLPARVDDAAAEVADIRSLSPNRPDAGARGGGRYRQPSLPAELGGARIALEATGIELSVGGAGETIDPQAESVLAWAVRAGATNIIRHSGASRAEITVSAGASATELVISGDGRGAARSNEDGEPGANGGPDPEGHGPAGLIERAHALGGTVEAAAGPDASACRAWTGSRWPPRRHGTVAELAAALQPSPGTTRNHLSSIMQKRDVHSRMEAIRVAEERGWL